MSELSNCAVYKEKLDFLNDQLRQNIIILISYSVYLLIAIAGTTDADFYFKDKVVNLPLIDVPVPTNYFYLFAPTIAAALHIRVLIYFSNLRSIYDILEVEENSSSGLIKNLKFSEPLYLIDWFKSKKINGEVFYKRDIVFISTFTILIFTPLIIALTYLKSLPAHNPYLSLYMGVILLTSLYFSINELLQLKRSIIGNWLLKNINEDKIKENHNKIFKLKLLLPLFLLFTITPAAFTALGGWPNNFECLSDLSLIFFGSIFFLSTISMLFTKPVLYLMVVIVRNYLSLVFLVLLALISTYTIYKTKGSPIDFIKYEIPLAFAEQVNKRISGFRVCSLKIKNSIENKSYRLQNLTDDRKIFNIETIYIENSFLYKDKDRILFDEFIGKHFTENTHNELSEFNTLENSDIIVKLYENWDEYENGDQFKKQFEKRWRRDREKYYDYNGRIKLANHDLSRLMVFSGYFVGANLSSSRLSNSFIQSSDLEGVSLSHSYLNNSIITYSNLININAKKAVLKGGIFEGSDFRFSNLEKADLSYVDLTEVDLKYSNISKTKFTGSLLIGTDMRFSYSEEPLNSSNYHCSIISKNGKSNTIFSDKLFNYLEDNGNFSEIKLNNCNLELTPTNLYIYTSNDESTDCLDSSNNKITDKQLRMLLLRIKRERHGGLSNNLSCLI